MELFQSLQDYPTIQLKKGKGKRLLYGYKWVFSNEISSPLSDFQPGDWVRVVSSKGTYLGLGYINPHSLITVRVICPPGKKPTKAYFRELIEKAYRKRKKLYPNSSCYRLFFSEADGLPGFIVDKYGEVLVYQANTQGISKMESFLVNLLIEIFAPRAIVFRNDSSARNMEQLPVEKGIAYGNIMEDEWINIDGIWHFVDYLNGQKTGLYLDQRENRKILRRFVEGKRILDLFCYDGGWSIHAAIGGAKEVVGIDQSEKALQRAKLNARRNNVENRCTFVQSDVFDFLRSNEEKFDIIISDPPAFVKNKKSLPGAIKGYTDLNRRSMLALNKEGILISCSCSHHLTDILFQEVLVKASLASGRQFSILEVRGQSPDHPVLLAMPETKYLKCYLLQMC